MLAISPAHWLVLLSLVVSLAGSAAYIRDTLKGRSKPNRVSWFIWAVAPIMGAFAALSVNADAWATLRTFMAGFVPLLIFLASFINPNSYWKLTKFDMACGILSVIALGMWLFADTPRLAILLLALGDLFAVIPTLTKAWKRPETETGITFVAGFVSCLLVIPSIPIWNIENAAFQVYLLIANGCLLFAVYRKRLGHVPLK